ncbi:MAG: hypothetical protein R2849_09955 [Thermomicrobiales bacterium]
MQCFERRCLTYTPDNAPGWQVEAGNVGQHYYEWRMTSQEGPSLDPAPPEVETALKEAANGDGPYQQLAAYLATEGFTEISQGATQASGPGVTPTEFLQVIFETAPPNPLQAALTFDPDMAGQPVAYAPVLTAQDELLYILYVDEAGQIQAQFPSPVNGTSRSRQLAGGDQCDICVAECLEKPIAYLITAAESRDSCESIAHVLCEGVAVADFTTIKRQIQAFNACVSVTVTACLHQSTISLCDSMCKDYCTDCTACPGTDESNFCCQGGCTNLDTDANNCGGCGQACAPGQQCCNGVCLDILSNASNCGKCGNACPEGEGCINGICTPPVEGACVGCDETDLANYCCDGVCLDLLNDVQNCGGCGLACFSGQICCDGVCLDPTDDDQNCGACGNVCPQGQLCCNSVCMDVLSDNQNCGACGFECGPDEECNNGICTQSDPCDGCQAGEACCDGVCIDVSSNDDHCGACGIECPAGTDCINGACVECLTTSDCLGCEVCDDGRCRPCPGTCCASGVCVPDDVCCPELIDCGGGLCCGGNYPICCPQHDVCCPAGYPVCCSSDFCCPASFLVCCLDDWCCPSGCTCTGNQGCHCPNEDVTLAAASVSGGPGAQGHSSPGVADISYW